MNMWGYYALHTFVNSIKKMFRSVVLAIIAGMFVIGLIFGLVFGVVASVAFPEDEEETVSQESYLLAYAGEEEIYQGTRLFVNEDGDFTDEKGTVVGLVSYEEFVEENSERDDLAEIGQYQWSSAMLEDIYARQTGEELDWEHVTYSADLFTEEDVAIIHNFVEAIAELLFIAFILFGIYSGSKKGSDIFLMADVNMLFTAPMKPQSVLMFRLSFQMVATFVGLFYLIFQIPNLLALGLSVGAILVLIFALFLMLAIQKLVSVLAYTITSTHEQLKKLVFPFVCVAAALVVGVTYVAYLLLDRDPVQTASVLYGENATRYIPFFGWFKAFVATAVDGNYGMCLLYGVLLIVGSIVLVWGIWQLKADFYEDALEGASTRDEIMTAAQEGRQVKKEKDRSEKIKRNMTMKGNGATAFFHKSLYNRRRFSYLGFLTKTMITYILTVLLIAGFCEVALEIRSFMPCGCILAGILFFRCFGNPIQEETALNWLFLVPDDPYKKVFSCMSAGTLACGMDLLPAVLVAGIWAGENPLLLLLWMISFLLVDFMLSSISVLVSAVIPINGIDQIKAMIQMMIFFIVLGIIVILFVVGNIFASAWGGLLLVDCQSLVLGTISFIVYPMLLHEGVNG